MNLHSFYDGVMVDQMLESYADPVKKIPAPKFLDAALTALKRKHPELLTEQAKQHYGAGSLVNWIMESQLLREGLYPDKPEDMKNVPKGEEYKNRAYCQWYVDQSKDKFPAPGSKIDESKIPTLTSEYADKHVAQIEMQIFKAGLRLASILDQIAKDTEGDPSIARVDDKAQASILKQVQDVLKNLISP